MIQGATYQYSKLKTDMDTTNEVCLGIDPDPYISYSNYYGYFPLSEDICKLSAFVRNIIGKMGFIQSRTPDSLCKVKVGLKLKHRKSGSSFPEFLLIVLICIHRR
jgi:hypothetical protein